VDYSEPDWTGRVRAAGGPVDVVLDGAGGAYGRAALGLVAPRGRFSGHGTPAGSFVGAGPEAAEGVTVTGIDRVQFGPERFRQVAAAALGAAADGRVTPLIGQTFPLDRAAEAHAAIENRTAIGKTLLIP
jgi:NADPH2:quinone reductase